MEEYEIYEGDEVILLGPEGYENPESYESGYMIPNEVFRCGFNEEMGHLVGTQVAVDNIDEKNPDGTVALFNVYDPQYRRRWYWDAKFAKPVKSTEVSSAEFDALLS